MARYVKMYVDGGYVGCRHEEIIKIPDGTTNMELDEALEDYLHNCIEYGWFELEPGDKGYGEEDLEWYDDGD